MGWKNKYKQKYTIGTFVFFSFFFAPFYFPASGQAVVTGVIPSPPRFLPSIFIAHRVQQSHCTSIFIFHRMLLTHALALSASQFVRKKKSPRIYTSMHSLGFELTKLAYTRLEDNLIRQRGDRPFDTYARLLCCPPTNRRDERARVYRYLVPGILLDRRPRWFTS